MNLLARIRREAGIGLFVNLPSSLRHCAMSRSSCLARRGLVRAPRADERRPIDFWNQQRRGTNFFSEVERRERFDAARAFGIELVRLAPNKWLNGRPSNQLGDFLLGRPASFDHIDQKDVAYLRTVLDEADKAGIKIVLTMLSLPGARWSQHNNNVEERRLWQDRAAQDQAIAFWTELASALKGHPAIVGYNIRNEPSPELVTPRFADWYTGDYAAWYDRVRGTPADLNLFYRTAVAAIRRVDPDTPIVLDSGFYATPWAFKVLEPVEDDKTIYSFHMYEPYAYTSRMNKGRFAYPGIIPTGESDSPRPVSWNKAQVEAFLAPVVEWQARITYHRLASLPASSALCARTRARSSTCATSSPSSTSTDGTGPSMDSGKTGGTRWTTSSGLANQAASTGTPLSTGGCRGRTCTDPIRCRSCSERRCGDSRVGGEETGRQTLERPWALGFGRWALGVMPSATGGRLPGRWIPCLRMRLRSVLALMPRTSAAPPSPSTRHCSRSSVATMWSRSSCASARPSSAGPWPFAGGSTRVGRSSPTCSVDPLLEIAAPSAGEVGGTVVIPRGRPVYTRGVRTHEWIDRRSLALHEAVAAKLEAQPQLLDVARANLARWLPAPTPPLPCSSGDNCWT